MEIIKHIPLALALVLFTYYYFAPEDKKNGIGLTLRLINVAAATVLMTWLFVLFLGRHYDFRYVYENSNNSLTLMYRISSVWAGQAGTFLLWYWLTALLLIIVRGVDEKLARGFYMGVGLVLIMLGLFLELSNPFELMTLADGFAIKDGMGLNPMLINPWMAIHPPLVFIGYAFIAVPFAFALGGVLKRDYSLWTRAARGWTLAAWAFLGAGIFLGSYWAYEVLGWGGYWGWDPVENASVFPWLVLGALAHGLIIQGGGKRFAFWNVMLAFSTLLMVVLTAFLTRSGALSSFSVHSFERSDLFYPILISFISIAVYSIALVVHAYFGIKKEHGAPTALPLGPQLLSWTAVVMVVLLSFIAAGTLYPIFSGSMAAINQSYYNKTTFLIAIPLSVLLLVCPFVFVKNIRGIAMQLRVALTAAGGAIAAAVVFLAGAKNPWFFVLAAIGGSVVVANLLCVWHFASAKKMNFTSYIVHLGVGLFIIGVLASSAPGGSKERVALRPGETVKKTNTEITFTKFEPVGNIVKTFLNVKYRGATYETVVEVTATPGREVVKPGIIHSGMGDLYISPVQVEPVTLVERNMSSQGGDVIEIANGKKTKIGGYEFELERWDISQMQSKGVVIAVVKMFADGGESKIELPFNANTQNRDGSNTVALKDGTTLTVTSIDASSRTAFVVAGGKNAPPPVANPANEGQVVPRVYYDVSVKPFISLLWWGMSLIGLGSFVAAFTRMRKIDAASRAQEQVAGE